MGEQPGQEQPPPHRGDGAVEESRGGEVEEGEEQEASHHQHRVGRDQSDGCHHFPGGLKYQSSDMAELTSQFYRKLAIRKISVIWKL